MTVEVDSQRHTSYRSLRAAAGGCQVARRGNRGPARGSDRGAHRLKGLEEVLDYKLYDHRTKELLGWLRNHGGLLPGDKIRWSGKDWDIKDGPKIQSTLGNPSLADVFVQEVAELEDQP